MLAPLCAITNYKLQITNCRQIFGERRVSPPGLTVAFRVCMAAIRRQADTRGRVSLRALLEDVQRDVGPGVLDGPLQFGLAQQRRQQAAALRWKRRWRTIDACTAFRNYK